MALPPDQARELRDALLDAFRDIEALRQMVFFRVGRNLLELANTGNLANAVFDLIDKLESYGELDQLLDGAVAERPGNPKLAAIVAQIRGKANSDPATPSQSAIRNPQSAIPGNPFEGRSTELLGRDRELSRVFEKLRGGTHCSVVGASGSGKHMLLDAVAQELAARLGWTTGCLRLNGRDFRNRNDLHHQLALHLGGQRANQWRSLWNANRPRLLIFDAVDGLPPGAPGLDIRTWLRGQADDGVLLLVSSNESLPEIFRSDPPTPSPFAHAFGLLVLLPPLPPDGCRRLVESRLAPFGLPSDPYADLYSATQQPKALLRRCAERYEALTEGHT